jgi:hypothetical protein
MEVKRMSEKWLESGDAKQYSWQGRYEKKWGDIVLSKKKVLFLEQRGFLKKASAMTLDIPYETIENVVIKGDRLSLIDTDGSNHVLLTDYALNVKKKLDDLRRAGSQE